MQIRVIGAVLLCASGVSLTAIQQKAAVAGGMALSGEARLWHKVTLTLEGPQADETAADPNPFMDYRMAVTFVHESGSPTHTVPGISPEMAMQRTVPRPRGTSGGCTCHRTRSAAGTGACRLFRGRALRSMPAPVRRLRRMTAGPDRSRSGRRTSGHRTSGRSVACVTSANTISSLPEAATTSSKSGQTRLKHCSPTRISTAPRL